MNNSQLKIVQLDGTLKFKHPLGYTKPVGYCFKHSELGYLAFKDSTEPYIPSGGRKALKAIIKAGGFTSFEGMKLVKPL